MRKRMIVDYSLRTGVFEGDLAYGRQDRRTVVKHEDFPAMRDENGKARNRPIMRLKLVKPRDPSVWESKCRLKKKRRAKVNTMQFQMEVLEAYKENLAQMRANMHVSIRGLGL